MRLKFLLIPTLVTFVILALPISVPDGSESFKIDFATLSIGAPRAQSLSSQTYPQTNEKEVQKIVETFFEAFHNQDSTLLRKVVHKDIVMQSIGKVGVGEVVLSKQDFDSFLLNICSIPDTTDFKEEILEYKVRTDGKMANVWTPYVFYVNNTISHCGTNSFQLFKRDGVWRIFYIVDTRDRDGCGEKRG